MASNVNYFYEKLNRLCKGQLHIEGQIQYFKWKFTKIYSHFKCLRMMKEDCFKKKR